MSVSPIFCVLNVRLISVCPIGYDQMSGDDFSCEELSESLKYLSRFTISFILVGNQLKKYYLQHFFKNFPPKMRLAMLTYSYKDKVY